MKKLIRTVIILLICAYLTACNDDIAEEYIPFIVVQDYVYDFSDDMVNIERRLPFIFEQSPVYDFSNDAAEAIAFVEAIHPNFIFEGRMCLEEYESFREIYLAATANPMTHTEFTLATQRFLTVFNDGHLSRTFLMVEQLPEEGFVFETTLFQDGDFIENYFLARGDRLFLADDNFIITETEVLAIGSVPVADIFAVIDYYFGAYNNAGVQRARGRYARYQLMLQLAGAEMFIYNECLVVDMIILENGIESVIETGFTSLHPTSYRLPDFLPAYDQRWSIIDGDVFYISIRSLIPGTDLFVLQEDIRRATDSGIHNFIIDLRNAPGGNPSIINYIVDAMGTTLPGHGKFMRIPDAHREHFEMFYPPPHLWRYFGHLTSEDFAGRDYVYVPRNLNQSSNPNDVFIVALTSERTFSGGTTIAVEIADSGFGKIIGEPSPTAPTGYGFGRQIILPSSRLQIRPHYTFYLRPDIDADPNILWPDIHVNEWEALDAALEFFQHLRY